MRAWSAVFLLALVCACSAEVFTGADRLRIQQLAENTRITSVIDAYNVAISLKTLGAQMSPNVCKFLSASPSTSSVASLFQLASAAEAASCRLSLATASKQQLQSVLESSKSLSDLFYATEAALAFVRIGAASVGEFNLVRPAEVTLALSEENGSFRSAVGDESANAVNGARGFHLLSSLLQAKAPLSKAARSRIAEVSDRLSDLLELGFSSSSAAAVDFASGDLASAAAASLVVRAVQQAAPFANKRTNLAADLSRVASHLLSFRHSDKLSTLSEVLLGLSAVAETSPRPALVVANAEAAAYAVRAVDALTGRSLPAVTVSLTGTKGGLNVPAPSSLVAAGDVFPLPAAILTQLQSAGTKPGLYQLKFRVESARFKAFDAELPIKVKGTVKLGQAEVFVSENVKLTTADQPLETVVHPRAFSQAVSAGGQQTVFVRLSLAEGSSLPAPSQIFLQLTPAHRVERPALFAFQNSASGKHLIAKAPLSLVSAVESLSGTGSYSLTLLVGDAALVKGQQWNLGTVNLEVSSVANNEDKANSEAAARPEIKHSFRSAESRAPVLLSLVFAAAAFVPLAGLVLYLNWLGVLSLQLGGTMSLVFQGSILAILGLYTFYWLQLNIFEAMVPLAILGAVAFFSGQRALSAHQRESANKDD